MTQIEKGFVSTIESSKAVAVTVPTRSGYVTEYLFVPPHVGVLKVNETVVFVEFDDLTGVILCKAEGR